MSLSKGHLGSRGEASKDKLKDTSFIFPMINVTILGVQDMFHVYLNKFEFHFLRLHINKTNKFCFFMHNRRVIGIAK